MSATTGSIEPGATRAGRLIVASGLYGPGTHPRSPLDNDAFARLVDLGHDEPADWTTFDPADLAAAGADVLPARLRDLWSLAVDAGWLARIVWEAASGMSGGADAPYATVEAGRRADPSNERGRAWYLGYTWHTYPTGTYRLSGRLAATPGRPAVHDGPSLRQARDIIAAHPSR